MSAEKDEKQIIKSFKLLHKIGRPLGLSCYTLPNNDEKQVVKVTSLDVVLFVFMFSFNIYLICYNYAFWEAVSTGFKTDTLFNTGIKLITTGSLILAVICMVVVFVMRERIWYIVITLQEISEKFAKYDIVVGTAYKYFGYYLLFSIITMSSIFFAFCIFISIKIGRFDILYLISYMQANVTFAYMCWKFQFLIFAVGIRFYLLNTMFEKKVNASLIASNASENPQLIGDLVFIVGDFHDHINSLATKINAYFAVMFLPIYGGNFTITVFVYHNLYKTFILGQDSKYYLLALFLLAMAIYFNILIVFITLGSEWSKKTANQLGVLVHKSITETQNKFILRRLNIISQQVLHISPAFSCGFFAMDWPMQFTFVSALASYLIILIQFQNYLNNE